jgi:hypothetical protein
MRKKHAISIQRIMEVLIITQDGLVVFRVKNLRQKAGSLPKVRTEMGRAYIRIDGKPVNLAKAAWAFHTGRWPERQPVQRRRDPYDYSMRNLVLGSRDR